MLQGSHHEPRRVLVFSYFGEIMYPPEAPVRPKEAKPGTSTTAGSCCRLGMGGSNKDAIGLQLGVRA